MKKLLSLSILAAVVLPAGCATLSELGATGFKKPTLRYKELILRDLSFGSVTLDFRFDLENPNAQGVKLSSLGYQLDLQGSTLLSGESTKPVEIPAQSSTEVDLPLTVDFKELADSLIALFQAEEKLTYALQATFGVETPIGLVRIPVKTDGEFPLPKLPKVRVADASMTDLSLLGATLAFQIELENPSEVPVRFERLSYSLSLADVQVGKGTAQPGPLEPNGKLQVDVPIRLEFLNLGASVVQMVRSRSIPYALKGELDLGFFSQPFELTGTAEL